MLKYLKLFLHQKKAIISIEMAIVFPSLITLFMFVLEFSRIMIIGSTLDLMTTEITRRTAILENGNYAQQMEQFAKDEVPLWPYLTNSNDLHITIAYCKKIQDVLGDSCQNTPSSDTRLILFNLSYDYYAIFSELFGRIIDSSLTKKTIVYREFYDN
ncbi:TadE/TadG family type IV pilus assembly protein [Gilliamella sp. Pas-s25]|uniref:TadE/TadG family type IV pilus assembly protein n=1 Tax=Gilliamella sp. Pas-s25 TaxID=2687310 RepID=UPI00135EB578|nr:TadE family protein [Gilliamella sp. Pas-s25]MWP62648.1 hypothetical protein [Gilliamella sp. Pas-s25]